MHSILIIALLAFWHTYTASTSCIHNTHLYQQSMKKNDKRAQVEEFGYVGIDGPTNWHTIDPAENLLCATGRNQSPINIIPTEIQQTRPGDVQIEIPAGQTLSFENTGTNVEVLLEGTTRIGSRRFNLRNFHYHTPGEHLVNEEYFPIEVHMVHEAEDNPEELAVIAFLFQLTAGTFSPPSSQQCPRPEDPSITFTTVLSSIFCIRDPGTTTILPSISFSPLTSAVPTMTFFTYSGSLTTPPCTEGVSWFIATEPLSMPVDAYNALKKVVGFNARFPQNRLGEENLISLACRNLNATEVNKRWSVKEQVYGTAMTPKQKTLNYGLEGSQAEEVIALASGGSFYGVEDVTGNGENTGLPKRQEEEETT